MSGAHARTKGMKPYLSPAQRIWEYTQTASYPGAIRALTEFWKDPKTRLVDYAELGRLDRFFLLVFLLRRPDANHPWLYDRCREVQADPYGYLDLWSRYHFKPFWTETPVKTTEGWVAHGSLRPGDVIADGYGGQTTVVSVTPHETGRKCYRIQVEPMPRKGIGGGIPHGPVEEEELIAADTHPWFATFGNKLERVKTPTIHTTEELYAAWRANDYSLIPSNRGWLGQRYPMRGYSIASIEECESVPVNCIQVDAPTKTYIVGQSELLTHNSTIITFAGSIQELINDAEITIAIFSYNKTIAAAFVEQIKTELEGNATLKKIYPEILYQHPRKESPSWSSSAITVKRKAVRREPTVSAWGLVDGMPTSMHFEMRIYDDVITERTVTNPEQIAKATQAVEMSWNLGTHKDTDREQYIGTRYRFGDTYQVLEDRGAVKVRKYPATDTGTIDGNPVFMSQDKWQELLNKSTLATIASQQLLDPMQGTDLMFDTEWIMYYESRPLTLNVYIMVDPNRTKKKTSDRTGIAVIGIDAAYNKYLLDGLCHRLTLSQRWFFLNHFRKKWLKAPGVQMVKCGYEIYGSHADLEHFTEQMRIAGEVFPIEELRWQRDAPDSHIDRVQRLEPDLRQGRFFFPYDEMITREEYDKWKLKPDDVHGRHKQFYLVKTKRQRELERSGSADLIAKPIIQKDENGDSYNLVDWMIANEYQYFPNIHVDFLDAMSRLYDMEPSAPIRKKPAELTPPPEPDA